MKKRVVSVLATIVVSVLVASGLVFAASFYNVTSTLGGTSGDYFDLDGQLTIDSLIVGEQSAGGVTFFNGTIINSTTTGGANNPVTFGDNVRIDGRLYRGATAGTSDSMPFIVNDNMEVSGSLTVSGDIIYDNTISGLMATSLQEAIDEIAVELSSLISGTDITTAGGFQTTEALKETTWKGYAYDILTGTYRESDEVTITFTPTTEASGTWASTPFNAFNPYNTNTVYYTDDLSGNYNIVSDTMFIGGMENFGTGITSFISTKGKTMSLYNDRTMPMTITVLTRQKLEIEEP